MEQLYLLVSFLLIVAAAMAIAASNPIHSLFWLVIVFLQASLLLISLKFEFLALLLILIYVGAIAILFVFVIMLLDLIQLKKTAPLLNVLPIIFIFGTLGLSHIGGLYMYSSTAPSLEVYKGWELERQSHLFTLATLLYTEYALLILLVSILLLIALVGAIVLTLELGTLLKTQSAYAQQQRTTPCT